MKLQYRIPLAIYSVWCIIAILLCKDGLYQMNIWTLVEILGMIACQRQDYWPFFAIFNVRYWSLMLSAFRHFIITDWRGVFCQHSRFAFFL